MGEAVYAQLTGEDSRSLGLAPGDACRLTLVRERTQCETLPVRFEVVPHLQGLPFCPCQGVSYPRVRLNGAV